MAPLRQIGRGTLIRQRRVKSLTIIEDFNIPEQIQLGGGASRIPLMVRELALERRPEAFHRCGYRGSTSAGSYSS